MKCTIQGRVVYDRKKHLFTMVDVKRIISKIEFETEKSDFESFAVFYEVLQLAYLLMLTVAFRTRASFSLDSIKSFLDDMTEFYAQSLKLFVSKVPRLVLTIILNLLKDVGIELGELNGGKKED